MRAAKVDRSCFADDPSALFALDFVRETLGQGKPVMIGWNDWGGHWQVIIGYETMGTDTCQDDVIITGPGDVRDTRHSTHRHHERVRLLLFDDPLDQVGAFARHVGRADQDDLPSVQR